jgi:DNA (cytosine-5)-methyltransferase 1
MKYLSVCSGIEAATVAWHPLGWEAVGFSEIEKFPSQVLTHHYPNVPNFGDMTKFKEWNLESNIDVFVGGTPCQSFSVAGLRKGLDDPRGNLMLTYLAIANQYRPKWLVWENVPGVLSSNGGLDFASLLRGMGECGYGFAYRILDAQYFGVAQRRRRVFVVGCLGDWRSAAAVLFERHSLSGNIAPSREKGKGATASIERSPANSKWPAEISSTLDTTFGTKQGLEDQHVNAGCPMFVPVAKTYGIPGNWIGRKPENGGNATEPMHNIAPCLTKTDKHGVAQPMAYNIAPGKGILKDDIHITNADAAKTLDASGSNPAMHQGGSAILQAIAYDMKQHHNPQLTNTIQLTTKNCSTVRGDTPLIQGTDLYNGAITGDITATMSTHGGDGHGTGPTVMQGMAVRRLTAKECERLQGFPDNYTDIKLKGKPTPDGPRYKALGNSMAVPVMAWIGKRIQEVENL